jgi:hypothetical protein
VTRPPAAAGGYLPGKPRRPDQRRFGLPGRWLLVAAGVLAVLLFHVSIAAAYVGESQVVEGTGPTETLSPAAEEIYEQPGTLPEVIQDAGIDGVTGPQDAGEAFCEANVLDCAAPVFSFVAGYKAGEVICDSLFSWCQHVEDEAPEPPFPTEGEWIYKPQDPFCTYASCTEVHNFALFYKWNGYTTGALFATDSHGGYGPHEGIPYPEGASGFNEAREEIEPGKHQGQAWRGEWVGKTVTAWPYGTPAPLGQETTTSTPTTGWQHQVATLLSEPGNPEHAKVGEFIASKIPGSGVENPWALTVTVPDCDGLVYATCADRLEEAGLKPHRQDLEWQHAHTADPPDTVEELKPARATEVEKGTAVTVVANPDESGMPVVIPKPGSHETYAQYVLRLNPSLAPHEVVVGELNESPAYGPGMVIGTAPAAGTALAPGSGIAVAVHVNPETASEPGTEGETDTGTGAGEGTGGFTPPAVPAIGVPGGIVNPCGVFPFGLFCWVKEAISQVNVSPKCPSAAVPLGVEGDTIEMGICKLPDVEHWMGLWRILVVFFFSIGCAWTFAKATGAIGAGGDD